jgi:hypothetical protein
MNTPSQIGSGLQPDGSGPGQAESTKAALPGILLATATIALMLAVGEVALRLAGYRPPVLIDSSVKGTYHFAPGASFDYVGYHPGSPQEFRVPIRLNGSGFNDKDYTAERPHPGTSRVLVLGDSYVAAMEVRQREAFHNLLEERLIAEDPLGSGSYEVIALGQGNRAQQKQLEWLREFGPRYRPDLVLLVFFCGNDIMENSPALFERARDYGRFQLRLAARKVDLYNRLFRFRSSRLNGFLAERAATLYASHLYLFDRDVTRAQLESPDAEVYRTPPSPEWLEAWRATEGLLAQIRSEAEGQGAAFALSVISGPQAISEITQERLEQNRRGTDLLQPERWVMEWSAKNRVAALSLGSTLLSADVKKVFWRHDAHLTPFGHRVVADALYPFLLRVLREHPGGHGSPEPQLHVSHRGKQAQGPPGSRAPLKLRR